MATADRRGHLDPFSGASGDMLLGAAIGSGADADAVREVLDGLRLAGWRLEVEPIIRGGLAATRARITTEEGAGPRTWRQIRSLLLDARIPDPVRQRSFAVFSRLAQVEADLHGVPVDEVAFHEVGALDSVVDIVGGCAALVQLDRAHWTSSPLALGSGTVENAHGLLPVPAPATSELLRGIPTRRTEVAAELCTPTGAAMLAEWVDRWDAAGDLVVDTVGYGAGSRELADRPNVLRITVGHRHRPGGGAREHLVELVALIDDQPAELVAAAADELRSDGALDVWTGAVAGKKGRLASELTCLCRPEDADTLERRMLVTTSTLGVRRRLVERRAAERERHQVAVLGRPVAITVGFLDDEVVTASPEHDDCRAVARATNTPIARVHELAVAAFWQAPPPATRL